MTVKVEELQRALTGLTEPGRLDQAQQTISAVAPQLMELFNESLLAGDWFGSAHAAELNRIASIESSEECRVALANFVAEETRLAMFVGAAIGFELRAQVELTNS